MSLPFPLTPAGCDMSGNDWFPLYFQRLQKSRWWRYASDLARSRSIDLWAEAYQAVPAGSLPNDDAELADLAGFGRDMASFLAIKDELMEPWVLCSDGRWYHPTMCEVVMEAWERLSEQRRQARSRKAAERARIRSGQGFGEDVTLRVADVTRDIAEKPRDIDTQTNRTNSPPTEGAPSAAADHGSEAWRRAKGLLTKSGGMKFGQAGKLFGRILSDHKLTAAELLPTIVKAETLGTADPQAYLVAAAKALAQRRGTGPPETGVQTWGQDQWRAAVRLWRSSGEWSPNVGPQPDEPGCRVPAGVLAEFGMVDGVTPLRVGGSP